MHNKKILTIIISAAMLTGSMSAAAATVEEPTPTTPEVVSLSMDETTPDFSVSETTENWIDSADTEWYSDGATEFEISTAEQLAGLAKLVNSGNTFENKTIKLIGNIDLAGKEWTPIGNSTNKFVGYFEGNDKTISNISITKGTTHLGLFGYIKGSGMSANSKISVQNLTIDGVNITPNSDYHGALAGQAFTCKIVNVSVKNAAVNGHRYIGGLIGHVYTLFEDCNFEGYVHGNFDQIGGIAGSGDCRAYRCSAIQGEDADYLVYGYCWNGGIVGGGQEGTSCVDCYVRGDIKSTSVWYGCSGAGIAGEAGMYKNCIFKNNYFDGLVYYGDKIVDAPIIGLVNTDDDTVLSDMVVEGNSWNTEKYSPELTVAVAAMEENGSYEDIVAAALRKENRNNNLVGSVADLQYVDVSALQNDTVITTGEIESVTFNSETNEITSTTTSGEEHVLYVTESGTIVPAASQKITVVFKETAEPSVYDIALVASDNKTINRLNSLDLTFKNNSASVSYEIKGDTDNKIMVTNTSDAPNRYEFNFNGKDDVDDTAKEIIVGTVTFSGYGTLDFEIDDVQTNVLHATKSENNIVDTFTKDGKYGGVLVINYASDNNENDSYIDGELKAPTKNLSVNVTFPNAITDNIKKYQDMKVTVSGGELNTSKVYDLGSDGVVLTTTGDVPMYTINIDDTLTENTLYTVTVEGAGYRTVRQSVLMDDNKTMTVWNNVKDEPAVVVDGVTKDVTFLAGDIVKDNNINIYDLSAVVSYFGMDKLTESEDYYKYAQYDLNRDGQIDSKDIAYVLVSWGK